MSTNPTPADEELESIIVEMIPDYETEVRISLVDGSSYITTNVRLAGAEIAEYIQANYTPNAQVERQVLEARIMELRKFIRHEIAVFGNCRTKDSIEFDIEQLQFKLTQFKETK